jgi:hypothetical protein
MPSDHRQRFYEVLKREFAPALRDAGFSGSHRQFRRVSGEVIHTLWIQAHRYGGRCAVNLGLHLDFLPVGVSGTRPSLETIDTADCAFTTRLVPGHGVGYWWRYGGLLRSPPRSARHLIRTYFEWGEPLFGRYATVEAVAEMVSPESLRAGRVGEGFAAVTGPRLALSLARIHRHLGDMALAQTYASIGLEHIGAAAALEAPLREIAGARPYT